MSIDTALTQCEREPIHLPGTVQPHGLLMALHPTSLRIEQVSMNAEALCGRSAESLIGQPFSAFLSAPSMERVRRRLLEGVTGSARHLGTDMLGTGSNFDMTLHLFDDVLIFEAELEHAEACLSVERSEHLRESLDRAERTTTIEALAMSVVDDVQRISGYERVMFYRFAKDASGEVIAEAIAPGVALEPFLGLRYPASDIPRQARAVMTQKRSRSIVDAKATAAVLLPVINPRTHRALDLTHAGLRSSSPVHLQYLANMGVTASLTISIVVDGKLWGLVACHHYSGPRLLSYDAGLSCEHLSRAVSLQVGRQLELHAAQLRDRGQTAREAFIASLPPGEVKNAAEVLMKSAPLLQSAIDADAFAVVTRDSVHTSGQALDEAQLRALTAWLNERGALDVWATDSLREAHYPDAEAIAASCSGLVAVPVTRAGGEWLLWLRAEEATHVRWAGRPEKDAALTPRRSFAAWLETVRFHSAPWEPTELQAARRVRVTLAELVYRHSEQMERTNHRLRQLNEELDAFAHIASHDLKTPIRSIRNLATWIIDDAGEVLPTTAKTNLQQVIGITHRMHELIESLMRFSRTGRRELRMEYVPLEQVVRDVLVEQNASVTAANARVVVCDGLPSVKGDPTMLREIVGNLVANALKYTDRTTPSVELGWRDGPQPGTAQLLVKDDGIGIPRERQAEVFQIFRRLHPQDAYQGGSGVGLSIVQNLVTRHGGAIDLESTPGEGTTFFVTLPTA